MTNNMLSDRMRKQKQKIMHNFFFFGGGGVEKNAGKFVDYAKCTGLGRNFKFNKSDNKAFPMYWIELKQKAIQSLTRSLSSFDSKKIIKLHAHHLWHSLDLFLEIDWNQVMPNCLKIETRQKEGFFTHSQNKIYEELRSFFIWFELIFHR